MAKKATAVVDEMKKLELLQEAAKKYKPVVGTPVKLRKGVYEGKAGVVKAISVVGLKLKFDVLIDGRSMDDPMGHDFVVFGALELLKPEVAALFEKVSGGKGNSTRKAISAAVTAIRTDINAGTAVKPENMKAFAEAIAKWNAAPGKPKVKKDKKAKK